MISIWCPIAGYVHANVYKLSVFTRVRRLFEKDFRGYLKSSTGVLFCKIHKYFMSRQENHLAIMKIDNFTSSLWKFEDMRRNLNELRLQ